MLGSAQTTYPVRTYTVLNPPMPTSLSGFASETGRLQLNINVDDVSLDAYPVKFKLIIKGNGIKMYTKPNMIQNPYYLNGGLHEVLTGLDLEPFFNPNNLVFEGYSLSEYQRTGRLPEGVYQISFELIDYYHKINISQNMPAVGVSYLTRAPRLTFPMNNSEVNLLNTPVIRFSWMGSMPNDPSAQAVYRFRLFEIRPSGRNAYEVVAVSNPIFTVDSKNPFLNYDQGLPPLIQGQEYAWQVQAVDLTGKTSFQNKGLSEVFVFKYGQSCKTPVISITTVGNNEVSVSYTGSSNVLVYRIFHRKVGSEDWIANETNATKYTIKNLDDNTGYEIKMVAVCSSEQSEESKTERFKTSWKVDYTCGSNANAFDLSNKEPLAKLARFDLFKAADFTIEVVEASGSNGVFTGSGFALVPYLNFVKLGVEFTGVTINADRRLIEGTVKFKYNEATGMVVGFSGGNDNAPTQVNALDALKKSTDVQLEVPDEIARVEINGTTVTVTTVNGQTYSKTVSEGQTVGISGANGKTNYVADTSSGQLYTSPSPSQNSASSSAVATAAQTGQYGVTALFKPAAKQKYGFDVVGDGSKKPNAYALLNKSGDKIAWKSLSSSAADYVDVDVQGAPVDSLRFVRSSGMLAPSSHTKTGVQLLMAGLPAGQEEVLTAALVKTDKTQQTLTEVGALGLVSYDRQTKNVVLVPINTAKHPVSAGFVKTELDRIYAPAVVDWMVKLEAPFTFSIPATGFDTEGTALLSKYTPSMNQLINAYKKARGINKNNVYLFFIDEPQSTKEGFMPLTGQYGFIFNYTANNPTLLSHELAHGTFNLRHTFSDKAKLQLPQGTTTNLMDYTNNTELWKYQWDAIHDPQAMLFAWAQDENEGASIRTDTSTIGTWKEIFPNSSDAELLKISRIYDTVAVHFDSLNINSVKDNIIFKGDLKDWSVRKSSHSGKLKQVAINIATKDRPDYSSVDPKEIYIENYTYETKIDTVKWTHNTNVALHSYVNAFNFTKPKITNLDKLNEITTIKVATFKLKSNNSTELGYIAPLDYNGVPSNDPKYKALPSYRIDDYALVAFYSNSGSNPDFVFQLIPTRSTKDYEVASWLKHLDILNDTASSITLSTKQLSQIFPNADTARIREVVNAINKYSSDFNITTPERMSHFLGQIGTETTGGGKPLSALVESCNYTESNIKSDFAQRVTSPRINTNNKTFQPLLNPDLFDGFTGTEYYFLISNNVAIKDTIYHLTNQVFDSTVTKYSYSGQGVKNKYLNGNESCAFFSYVYCCNKSGLGNGDVASGDGALFRGRGFIHLTGRSNYETKFYNYWKKEYPNDTRTLEQIVTLLETDVDLAMKVSMIFWKYNGINQTINSSSFDSNNDEIRQVSVLVNGGDVNKKPKDKIAGYTTRESNTINAYNVLSKK